MLDIVIWGLLLGNKADTEYIPSEYLSDEEKFYCDNGFFFNEDDWILNNCKILSNKRIFLAHGDNDIACSHQNSYKIKSLLNNINLYIEPNGFHSSSSIGIEQFLIKSIEEIS